MLIWRLYNNQAEKKRFISNDVRAAFRSGFVFLVGYIFRETDTPKLLSGLTLLLGCPLLVQNQQF